MSAVLRRVTASAAREQGAAGRAGLAGEVAAELRWALRPPFTWLSGVAVNLVLASGWLLAVPLRGRPHADWAIIVGTYFAIWVLADVTTTNLLGADAKRLGRAGRPPLGRVLLAKNLALLVLVGVPTLAATAVLTVVAERDERLLVTLPRVLFTVLTWIGVGNLISVLLPVPALPLGVRWRQRRDLGRTALWLFHLAVPYGLLVLVDPVERLPGLFSRWHLLPRSVAERGAVLLAMALAVWGLSTLLALAVARRRDVWARLERRS